MKEGATHRALPRATFGDRCARDIAAFDKRIVTGRDVSGASIAESGARQGSVSGTFFHAIDRG